MLLLGDVLSPVHIDRSLNMTADLVKVEKLNSLVNALISGVVPISDILGKIPIGVREDCRKVATRLKNS